MTTSIATKAIGAVLAVLITTGTFAEVTHARETGTTVSMRIDPQELTKPEGRAAIRKRAQRVARRACGAPTTTYSYHQMRRCREDIAAKLLAKLPRAVAAR